jgi:glycosyltransferase involved in cell wall biosynthesis
LDASLPLVSIIVPARDEIATIADCVRALLAQDYPRDRLEIIVVDGRSTDGTREVVASLMAETTDVLLVDNPDRITPVAFNRGIRAARGEIIGVMSAHGVAARDYVSVAVGALATTKAWCVGGRIDRVASTPLQRAIAAATSSPFGVGDATHNYRETAGWVETAFPGLWPRWVFERVGLFDPELVRNQDDELSDRIRAAGGRIWFEPRAVVAYVPRGSRTALFRQYRQYAMWKIRVFQRHPWAARPRHLIPAAWIGTMVVGAVASLWAPPAILLTAAAAGAYATVMSLASLRISGPGVRAVDVLTSLVTLHVAYGIGTWQGLVRFLPRWFHDRGGTIERLEQTT